MVSSRIPDGSRPARTGPPVVLCLGTPLATTRDLIRSHLPPGFALVFADEPHARSTEELAGDADYLFVWSTRVSEHIIRSATRVKLIQKIGEGSDKIDVEAASRASIPVAKTSGENSVSTAEMALLLILATLRRLPEAHNSLRARTWRKWEVRAHTYELRGKQVGIVGLGKVGRLVSGYVQAFGATVVYHGRHRLAADIERALSVRYLDLDGLLRTSDVVSLHVPSTPSTAHLIGRSQLGLMKPTAILVNTSRGELVDEDALYEALTEGRILGCGLDVFSSEPPSWDSRLLDLDSVVMAPHVAGVTEDSQRALVQHAFANITLIEAGGSLEPADVVVPPVPSRERTTGVAR